jgi:hypothetical protein
MSRTSPRWAAVIAAGALFIAACGDDDDTATAPATEPGGQTTTTTEPDDDPATDDAATDDAATDDAATTDDGPADDGDAPDGEQASVDTPAAELRAGLTSLLQEHVYLAGAAINQAVADGGDMEAPGTTAAVEALDENSVQLSEAVGSVYGDEAAEQFLALWRDHIGMFVDYTLGGATGDTEMQEQAAADLDAYRAEFGAFIESATEGELDSATVEEELDTHVQTLVAAVDSVLAGEPDVYPNLKEAAGHMPMVATALSGAIVAQQPDAFAENGQG